MVCLMNNKRQSNVYMYIYTYSCYALFTYYIYTFKSTDLVVNSAKKQQVNQNSQNNLPDKG